MIKSKTKKVAFGDFFIYTKCNFLQNTDFQCITERYNFEIYSSSC